MSSTYVDDYDWKTNVPDDPNSVYNRSKHNSFEGAYREHIPTSLISTAKMSFKPFKVKEEEKQKPKEKDLEVPFIGKSTYNRHYPSWGKLTPNDNTLAPREEINVPLRGVPNYKESYPRYDDKYYNNGEPLNFCKSTLKFDKEARSILETVLSSLRSKKTSFPELTSDNKSLSENRIGVFFIVGPQLVLTFQTPNTKMPIPSEGSYL